MAVMFVIIVVRGDRIGMGCFRMRWCCRFVLLYKVVVMHIIVETTIFVFYCNSILKSEKLCMDYSKMWEKRLFLLGFIFNYCWSWDIIDIYCFRVKFCFRFALLDM